MSDEMENNTIITLLEKDNKLGCLKVGPLSPYQAV
jgi:hypothetical protein